MKARKIGKQNRYSSFSSAQITLGNVCAVLWRMIRTLEGYHQVLWKMFSILDDVLYCGGYSGYSVLWKEIALCILPPKYG